MKSAASRRDHNKVVSRVGSTERGEIWLVGTLPPPVHGPSVNNAAFARFLEQHDVPCRIFQVGTRGSLTKLERWSFAKAAADGWTVSRLGASAMIGSRTGPVTVYFIPSQAGYSVIRDAAVGIVGRRLTSRVVAHLRGCGWLQTLSDGEIGRAHV